MGTTINLIDTSFLLYVQIDSEERKVNLGLVISHILMHFNTNIFLLEVDATPKMSKSIIEKNGIEYEFIEDSKEIFHTTKYRNYLVSKCRTPYFFICDSDVIASPQAIIDCIDYLKKSSEKSLVYPYNGDFYNVSKEYKDEYSKTMDYKFLIENQKEHFLWFKHSVGGVFGGKTSQFKNEDIDNEKIYGWGPDDKERYYRLKRKGFEIMHANFPLYHLYHQRNLNSRPVDEKIKVKNQMEYLKVFAPDF